MDSYLKKQSDWSDWSELLMKVAMELYKIANGPILIGSRKKLGRIATES